jgi:mono/diheme cytochrome c family protein
MAAMLIALPALAQEIAPGAAVDPAEGGRLFQYRCATCHGAAGDGTGPMAPVLLVQPTDLTGLQAANGGVFPMERVIARIDGRDPLVSHGSQMPVYGDFFQGHDTSLKTAAGQPILTSRPMADLAAWLQSIQQ